MISRVTRVVRRGIIPKLRAPRPGSKDYGGSGRGQLESRNSCEPSVTTLILARCPRMGGIVAEDLLEKSERGVNQWEKRGKGERGKGKRGRERGKKNRSSAVEITAIIARVRCFHVAEHHLNHEWFINFMPGYRDPGGPRATRPEEPN